MATLDIEGIGPVTVSDDFAKLSAEQQQQTANDIARQINAQRARGVAADMQQPDYGSMSAGQVAKEAVSNIPSSAANAVSAMAQPFLHPVETATNLKNIGLGVLEKIQDQYPGTGTPLTRGHEQYAEAVGQFLVDRYGSGVAIKKALATDPVGVAADVSMLLTGGGTAASRLPGVAGKIGEAARAVAPGNLVSKAVKAGVGVIGKDTAAERAALSVANVNMTPGQMIGGVFKSVEDAATSIPILGDFINSGRARSVESFNQSVMNQALAPIGEKLSRGTVSGHEAVDEVATKLGKAYDTLLPQLTYVPDADFANDMKNIISRDVQILPKQYADQYMSIIRSRLPMAPMSGKDFKKVESELTKIANDYRSSADGAQRSLSDALDSTITAMRTALERSNPGAQAELAKINSGYAMYARIRAAAARRTAGAGVFTPNDLLAAVKSADKSVGKGSFARGDALMQTFAEAGQKVLPSKIPDSGTARRVMAAGGLGYAGSVLGHPIAAAAGAAAIAPYTKTGMKILNRRGKKLPIRALGQSAFQTGRLQDQ